MSRCQRFEVRAHGALALAALVDRDRGVVDDLQERHHALALAVGALDVGAEGAHARPVVAQAAGVLGQQRVLFQRLVDAVQVVSHRRQVAARQLRAPRARVEQRGRARHEVEARQDFVELDRPRLAVDLVQRQAHRHAHEERLRHLDARFVDVQEVAVVQRLQAEVVELQVALRLQRRGQPGQVELEQLVVQQLGLDAALDELREVVDIGRRDVGDVDVGAQDFAPDGVHQQARGGAGVARLLLEQRARGQDRSLEHLVDRHAVVQVAPRLGEDGFRLHVGTEVGARGLDERLQRRGVQRHTLAAIGDVQFGRLGRGRRGLARALLRAAVAVEHIGPSHFMVAAAHQAEFDMVLHVFDVERTATRARAQQGPDHGFGQPIDRLAYAGRGRTLRPVHGQERLHQRDRDLVRLERHHRPVAANDLVRGESGRGRARGLRSTWRDGRFLPRDRDCLH